MRYFKKNKDNNNINIKKEDNYNIKNKKKKERINNSNYSDNKNHRHKFLLCCGGSGDVVMGGVMARGSSVKGRGEDDPVIKYIKMEEKEGGVIFPRIFPADLSPRRAPENDAVPGKKKKGIKSLTRVLKAVLFETSLAKKIRRRKLKKYQSKEKSSAKFENDSKHSNNNIIFSKTIKENLMAPKHEEVAEKDGARNTSKAPSLRGSHASSVSSHPRSLRSNSIDSKMKLDDVVEHGKQCHSVNTGLCLVLLSLLVLVLWGKVCAIVCTSTWLFLVPRWNFGSSSHRYVVDSRNIDSEEYKKKVILEGLLERNRNRGM